MGFGVCSWMLRWSPSNFKHLSLHGTSSSLVQIKFESKSLNPHAESMPNSFTVCVSLSLSPLLNLETGCGHYSNWGEENRKRRGAGQSRLHSFRARVLDHLIPWNHWFKSSQMSTYHLPFFPIIRFCECDFSTWVLISMIFPMSSSLGCGGKRTNWLE